MHQNNFKLAGAALLALMLVLNGCFGGGSQTPATRFYELDSLQSADNNTQSVAVLKEAIIGIGPITMTQVLDRPHIIIRHSPNEIRVSELNRWAEPLRTNFIRVMADNISVLLSTERVIKFPWKTTIPVTYQVLAEVSRFDGKPGDNVVLSARWTILDENGPKVLVRKLSILTEPTGGDSIAEMVSAQSRLVAKLSHEIAEEIKQLEEKKSGQ